MRRVSFIGVVLLFCTWHGGLAAQPPAPNAQGHLVIVGGGPIPDEIDRRFVDLAGGAGKARIVVLPMASESGAESGAEKAASFRKLGAVHAVSLNLARTDTGADSVARMLGQATGIWFPGGDQNRLTAAILGTAVLDSIRSRYRHGAVVGGTSAGAAVMSDPMISGDERRPGGTRPPSDSSDGWMTIDRDDVVLVPGFGLLPNVTVDQHFLRRRRHNRLISVVLEHPMVVGIGIDESTALVVSPQGPWEVIGASQATIYDARRATVTSPGKPLGASEIRMHVVPAGGTFDLATGTARLSGIGNRKSGIGNRESAAGGGRRPTADGKKRVIPSRQAVVIPRYAGMTSGGNSSSQQQAAVARSRRLPAQQRLAASSGKQPAASS